jgi:hypothetical protein
MDHGADRESGRGAHIDLYAIVPGLHGAIDELVSLGLAAGPADGWTVTIEGRRLAERLTDE